VPYGTRVTFGVLEQVGGSGGERLHRLGFDEVRVRHYGELARLEIPLNRLGAVHRAAREAIVGAVQATGYSYVTLDLEGLRSGTSTSAPPGRPLSRPLRRFGGAPEARSQRSSALEPFVAPPVESGVRRVLRELGRAPHRRETRGPTICHPALDVDLASKNRQPSGQAKGSTSFAPRRQRSRRSFDPTVRIM